MCAAAGGVVDVKSAVGGRSGVSKSASNRADAQVSRASIHQRKSERSSAFCYIKR